jgi:hypothetical protein
MIGYLRKPSPERTSRRDWCITRLPNGTYRVRIWQPGKGLKYIGVYPSMKEAAAARDEVVRDMQPEMIMKQGAK